MTRFPRLAAASVALLATVALFALNTSMRPSAAQTISGPGLTLSDVQAMMPQPSDAAPPMESVTPSAGTAPTYRRSDAQPTRITRATTVTTVSGGTFSGTWSAPLPNAPVIVLTPISANASIDCQLTAAPTTSTFQGRCWTAQTTLLNLSIITAGLTLNPMNNTAAGVQVQVLAIPPTQ